MDADVNVNEISDMSLAEVLNLGLEKGYWNEDLVESVRAKVGDDEFFDKGEDCHENAIDSGVVARLITWLEDHGSTDREIIECLKYILTEDDA